MFSPTSLPKKLISRLYIYYFYILYLFFPCFLHLFLSHKCMPKQYCLVLMVFKYHENLSLLGTSLGLVSFSKHFGPKIYPCSCTSFTVNAVHYPIHFFVDRYVSWCVCAKVSFGYVLLSSLAPSQVLIFQNYGICSTHLLSSDLNPSNL